MAEEQVVIDIKLETGQAAERLAALNTSISAVKTETRSLRAENNKLSEELKEEGADVKALTKQMAENTQKIVENEKVVKAMEAQAKSVTGALQSQIAINRDLGGSYYELRASAAQLEKEYKSLTAAQRESAEGKQLKAAMLEAKNAANELDKSLGNMQWNVGNYPGTMGKLDSALKTVGTSMNDLASGGAKAFKSAFENGTAMVKSFSKTLLTTPIGWIAAALTALVAVFDKVRTAIAKNDDAATNLSRLYAVTLGPAIERLTDTFGKLATWIGNVAGMIADWLGEENEAAKTADRLVVATDKLEEAERQYARSKAKNEAEISRLRAEAADAEAYTLKDRQKMLKEAQELEKQNLEEGIKIAEERLRIAKEENRRNKDTSDEAKNRENALMIERDTLQAEYNNRMRKYTRELQSLAKQEAKAEQETTEEVVEEDKKKIYSAEELANARLELQRKVEDDLLATMQDGDEKKMAQIELQRDREISALEDKYAALIDQEPALQEELNNAILAVDRKYAEQKKQITDGLEEQAKASAVKTASETKDSISAAALAAGDVFSAFGDLVSEFGGKNKQAQKAAKAFGLASVAVSEALNLAKTAESISNAVAGATAAGAATGIAAPFTTPVFIATTTAAVLSGLAGTASTILQAKQILSGGKFATGGIVGGTSYTGDNVSARVNSGEMVLTRQQQTQLFEIANGGYTSATSGMVSALTEAIASQPAPVVLWSDFEAFGNKQTSINNFANI